MTKSLNCKVLGITLAAVAASCGGETETVRVVKDGLLNQQPSGGTTSTTASPATTGSASSSSSTTGTGVTSTSATSSTASGAGGASTSGGTETTTSTVGMGGNGGASTTTGGMGGSTGGGSVADAGNDAAVNGPINVLVFNHTEGYGHQSRQTAIPLLQAQGMANNINFDVTYAHVTPVLAEGTNDAKTPVDLSAFTPGGLDKYDVVFFLNTTGHAFQASDEATHQQALQAYMEQHHGGFIGTHSAADTYDDGWQWYQDFIGSIYSGHSNVVAGSARWKDGVSHPILTLATVPNPWNRQEEWYEFRRDVTALPDFTVLLLADAPGQTVPMAERPITWVHQLPGGGRAFYCAFGHLVGAFQEPAVMKMLITGIKWAAHRIP